MENDREKWNRRYLEEGYYFSLTPSPFLAESLDGVLPLLPGRRALDLACGEGRNAIYLARRGFQVVAVDIAEKGLEKGEARAEEAGVKVDFRRADLEEYRLAGSFDLIVDFNFLLRPLIPDMVEALNPGGVIVMETILDTPSLQGMHNRSFLLLPGELKALFAQQGGEILAIEEEPLQETPVARVIFRKRL
ncbi:class I SAM-dependent methyltransferase [Geomonas sp. Red32]|uniref:class I SAM-dependent methyltransferase n=1 Tax=Geomonas sp. Red32 TaxID=2912856 RepID=UPI00202D0BC2|nr:class I SAM-dependent methyltransferase [Geomonas sp. Red32]MCM0082757.1 class I SAM-dependent methyltransferase [Geomonas sp. Red32]